MSSFGSPSAHILRTQNICSKILFQVDNVHLKNHLSGVFFVVCFDSLHVWGFSHGHQMRLRKLVLLGAGCGVVKLFERSGQALRTSWIRESKTPLVLSISDISDTLCFGQDLYEPLLQWLRSPMGLSLGGKHPMVSGDAMLCQGKQEATADRCCQVTPPGPLDSDAG